MNKSEIKVEYVVRTVTTNAHVDEGRKGKRRPKSAGVSTTAGRRNSLLAATIQEEFISKKSNSHHNGGGSGGTNRKPFGNDTHSGQRNMSQSNRKTSTSIQSNNTQQQAPVESNNAISAPPILNASAAMRSRPETAPKRRPPVMVYEEDDLPLWRSRGSLDMTDTLLRQDNKVSIYRRKEWPIAPKKPASTETVLGLENSDSRKSIKSSHSRSRFPKTSGPIANLKPYNPPPHYFPAAIVRSETPAESPSLRDRERWSFETTYEDIYERAKPIGKPDISADHFHETYRLPTQFDKDYIEVTRGIETITAAYPRGRF